MSTIHTYLPLYRKYRPATFADVVGQPALVQALSNAITMDKVAHAYLFCGPRGTGKTSTARIFAKSLNCQQGPTPTPCLVCPSCLGITAGNALDIIEFDAASHGGVEDARDLIESTQFASISGKYKIYIIDEVHMLSSAAFNALLKTLEEPPPRIVFILATTESHKVLPTIVSRCQRFDFQRVTLDALVDRLQFIANQEGINIDPEALRLIARKARGGLRDAVSQLDQVAVLGLSHPETSVSVTEASDFLGLLDEATLVTLLEAVLKHEPATVLSMSQAANHRGLDPYQLIAGLIEQGRALLWLLSLLGGATVLAHETEKLAQTLDIQLDTASRLSALVTCTTPLAISQLLSRLSRVEREMRLGQDPWLWFEVGILDATFQTGPTAQTAASQIETAQSITTAVSAPLASVAAKNFLQKTPQVAKPSTPTEPTPYPEPLQAASPSSLKTTPATSQMPSAALLSQPRGVPETAAPQGLTPPPNWETFVGRIGNTTTLNLVKQMASFGGVDETTLTLSAKSEAIASQLRAEKHQMHLAIAAKLVYQRAMQIQIVVAAPAPASTPTSSLPSALDALPAPPTVSPSPMPTERSLADEQSPKPSSKKEAAMQAPPLIETSPEHAALLDAKQLADARNYTLELLQGTLIES
ncbi:MAG: DNA polymerase III subunit gamma/tau [Vampirovibrionales bacterium]|nr:DNA polymerase III subunit gamma/tau [Vampirovibrionales bacterium]